MVFICLPRTWNYVCYLAFDTYDHLMFSRDILLGVRRNEPCGVGARRFYVGDRSVLVRSHPVWLFGVRSDDPQRRQALPCIALGYIIISVVMVLNGTTGARLHVAFPVLNRSSFGFWFSYFTVSIRVILSMFWFGIQVRNRHSSRFWLPVLMLLCQSYNGSQCVYQVNSCHVERGFTRLEIYICSR